MADLPTIMTKDGLQPQSPATIQNQLIASVSQTNPGYTANLPGSLIEDISSTDVAAVVEMDSARVETVNSLTPYGANAWLLNQLGQIYGVEQSGATNTSVYVIFIGPAGYVIPQGFTISDGTYQYVVQDGGVIGAIGQSAQLFCVATVSGSWAVPVGSVTNIITSVPTGYNITCYNPLPGVPGQTAESETNYRTRVLQAGLAASQGMASYLKTLVNNVSGVQTRLISVQQVPNNNGWKIIVGGGDEYAVAYAIYSALFDISSIVGSTLEITNITQANPGVVTTNLLHQFQTGQVIYITGVSGMTLVNNTHFTITVIDGYRFSLGVNTFGYSAYTGGGVVTPNLRNITASLTDYPDVYQVTFVNPPLQTVAITVTWNTTATNFVSQASVAALGQPALVDYVNSIYAGQPMNLFELQTVFQTAIASVLSPQLLTRMIFAVSINGVGVAPEVGTGIIAGDSEGYFFTTAPSIVIAQG